MLIDVIREWGLGYIKANPPTTSLYYNDGTVYCDAWITSLQPKIMIHKFYGPDRDGYPHDHEFDTVSFCIDGQMTEEYRIGTSGPLLRRTIRAGDVVFRGVDLIHSLPVGEGETATTVYIEGPPQKEEWYFYTPSGKVSYTEFRKGTLNDCTVKMN
jgi:hypothetical protein